MLRFPGLYSHMKKVSVAILLITFITTSVFAQTTMRGRVIDAETNSLGLNIQNALNKNYINEADETWAKDPNTGIKEQGTVENGLLEGYWSYSRTISFSVKVAF